MVVLQFQRPIGKYQGERLNVDVAASMSPTRATLPSPGRICARSPANMCREDCVGHTADPCLRLRRELERRRLARDLGLGEAAALSGVGATKIRGIETGDIASPGLLHV